MAFSFWRKHQALQGRYTPRLWPVWIVAPAILAAVSALGWAIYQYTYDYFARAAADQTRPTPVDVNDVLKTTVTVLTLIGAVLAGLYAYRKQLLAEGDAHRADASQLADRYTTAAEQLGHGQAAVRLAGVYALARLADDWEEQRQVCIDVLCSYLRMPYEPDTSAPNHRTGEREVRDTILRIIANHLNNPHSAASWCRYNFDFTNMVFDACDFSGSHFHVNVTFRDTTFNRGRIAFSRAAFSGGAVSFDGATFGDGEIVFVEATFNGGRVSFDSATFNGGAVSFDGATFSDSEVAFGRAQFNDGAVSFGGATFGDGEVTFDQATFNGSQVSFDGAAFEGGVGRTTFRGARFKGGAVTFNHAEFTSGAVIFDRARFRGGTVIFNRAEFKGSAVNFDGASFGTCPVTFEEAAFRGGAVTFNGATVHSDAAPLIRTAPVSGTFGTVRSTSAAPGADLNTLIQATPTFATVTFNRARFTGAVVEWGPLPVPAGAGRTDE